MFLDLSSNYFSYLGSSFLCVSSNLKYLFLQNNRIVFVHRSAFYFTQNLATLYLQGNALLSKSIDAELLEMQSNLITLFSDLPRLCCMVSAETRCTPKFTLFVSCSDMMHSRFYVFFAWIIGVITSTCNVTCILILTVIFCLQQRRRSHWLKQPAVVVMSFNITIADMVVSLCLLSLSVYNEYYQGVFGAYADVWRHSIACYSLELSLFVCTECSLIFSVILATVSYVQITSLFHTAHSMKKYLRYLGIALGTWLSMVLMGIGKLILWNLFQANNFNYYCLPFQIMRTESTALIGIQTSVIAIDMLLIGVYIAIQFCLLFFLRGHAKATGCLLKSRIRHHKIAVRMSCIITSNILTWSPILFTQLFIMYWKDINPSILLLVLLVSLPANLLVNPIILVIPFLPKVRVKKHLQRARNDL